MSNWNPKRLWEELVETLLGSDDERDERSFDPNLAFHLMFIAPLLMGLLLLARRT